MANQRILVIGGTGYIGMPLVEKLIGAGYDVTLLVQRGFVLPEALEKCKHFFGDLLDKEGLAKDIQGFDLAVNLAAVIRTRNKKKYEENVRGMKNLIDVLEIKGIKRIVYFSTQSVNLKDKGPYGKSKEAAERLLKESSLDYVIIRPNYVYGIDRVSDIYKLAFFIHRFKLALVIGNGEYRIQPVLKDDLVDCVFGLVGSFQPRSVVEVSGKETISINEAVKLIENNLNVRPMKIHLPFWLLRLFQNFVPFDVKGYTEDRISQNPCPNRNFSSFRENIKEIIKLLK